MKIAHVVLIFLLATPFAVADAYGNGTYGNGTYPGQISNDPPTGVFSVTPVRIATTASSQISCSGDDANGVISVVVNIENSMFCNSTNFTGLPHMGCSFSFTPSEYNDVTKNYSVSCRIENVNGLTTNFTGSLYALKDTGNLPGGGGGGGSGGYISPETFTFSTLTPGVPVVKLLSNSNVALKEIYIEVLQPTEDVRFTIKRFNEIPAVVPQGNVFQYIQVNVTNLGVARSIKFRFNVTKFWMTQNGWNASDISLRRFSGVWQKLPTRIFNENSFEVEYESDVPGFSLFAIIAEKPEAPGIPVQPPVIVNESNQTTEQQPSQLEQGANHIVEGIDEVTTALRAYAARWVAFFDSLIPARSTTERSLYYLAIFIAIQAAIYIFIRRVLEEKKKKEPRKPLQIRHNEKLHRAAIFIIVMIIFAYVIFIMRL